MLAVSVCALVTAGEFSKGVILGFFENKNFILAILSTNDTEVRGGEMG